MSMSVVAVITAKPGSEGVVGTALHELVAPTRAEAGCESYELYESSVAPGTFITVEVWADPSDLDAHMASAHIAAAMAGAEGHFASAPAIHPLTPLDV